MVKLFLKNNLFIQTQRKTIIDSIIKTDWKSFSDELAIQLYKLLCICFAVSSSDETKKCSDEFPIEFKLGFAFLKNGDSNSILKNLNFRVSLQSFKNRTTFSLETLKDDSKLYDHCLIDQDTLNILISLISIVNYLKLPFIAYNFAIVYCASISWDSTEEDFPGFILDTLRTANESTTNKNLTDPSDSDESNQKTYSIYLDAIDEGARFYDATLDYLNDLVDASGDDLNDYSNFATSSSTSPRKRVRFSLGPTHMSMEQEEACGGRSNKLRLQDFARRRHYISTNVTNETDSNTSFLFFRSWPFWGQHGQYPWYEEEFDSPRNVGLLNGFIRMLCYFTFMVGLTMVLSLLILMVIVPSTRELLFTLQWSQAIHKLRDFFEFSINPWAWL